MRETFLEKIIRTTPAPWSRNVGYSARCRFLLQPARDQSYHDPSDDSHDDPPHGPCRAECPMAIFRSARTIRPASMVRNVGRTGKSPSDIPLCKGRAEDHHGSHHL